MHESMEGVVDSAVLSVGSEVQHELCDIQHLEQSLNIFRTRLRKRNDRISELEDINKEIEKDLELKDESNKRLRAEVVSLRERNIEMKRIAGEMEGFDDEALRLRGEVEELQHGLRRYCENSAAMKVCGELCAEVADISNELGQMLDESEQHMQLSAKIFAWYLREEKNPYSKIRLSEYIYRDISKLQRDLAQAQQANEWIVSMQRPRPEDGVKIAKLSEELKTAKATVAQLSGKVAVLEADNKKMARRIEVHMN